MRVDDFTLEKERFDYARVLVATSSLKIINVSAKIVVDGVLLEDACLSDEDGGTEVTNSDMAEPHDSF